MTDYTIALAVITLLAAIVNGALGYGFSSITVWNNRDAFAHVWRRVLPVVIGLLPGVILGTAIVSQVNPGWLRFVTFTVLLPLILIQAAGYPGRSTPNDPRGSRSASRSVSCTP
jgi:hypothetical protein